MASNSSDSVLSFEPAELRFVFEPNTRLSCSIQVSNKTAIPVAFKLKSTNPKVYGVRPRIGIISPGSSCNITVTKRAMKEAPHDMRCKDKFMIQSVAVSSGTTMDDADSLFKKESGRDSEECKLQVVYVSPPPEVPSPVDGTSKDPPSRKSANDDADFNSKQDGAGSTAKDVVKQENDGNHVWEFIAKSIAFCLVLLVSWYLMKPTLSLIWSLTMIASMLMIKMIKQLVSESVEDWIVKGFLCVFMHLLSKRKANLSQD